MLIVDRARVTLAGRQFSFSLSAEPSSVHAILGRSGSGKSTLLNLIGGFLKPDSGDISWQQQSLIGMPTEARPVTTLFQQHNLFDHLTVRQNVGLGLHPGLKLNVKQHTEIDVTLADMGLSEFDHKRPTVLSGGEKQRVALARCLLRHKPVLLLDEPYNALDTSTRDDMLSLTKEVISRRKLCVILVTHNPAEAEALDAGIHHIVDGKL